MYISGFYTALIWLAEQWLRWCQYSQTSFKNLSAPCPLEIRQQKSLKGPRWLDSVRSEASLIGQRQTNQGESCIRAAGQIFSPLFAAVKIIYRHCRQYWQDCSMRTNRLERLKRLLRPAILWIKVIFCHEDSEHSFWLDANFYIVAACMKIIYIAHNNIMARL